MSSSFWDSFLANFLSDLLVGGVLGAFMAWWIGKRLSDFELSQQRKSEKRAEIEKTVRYLEFLRGEAKYLVDRLPRLIEKFQETGWGREVRIPTPFWDILQPSGELPRLLNPQLLAELTHFYDHLAYAKRAKEIVIDSWLVPHPETVPGMDLKLVAFVDMTLSGLKKANELGEELLGSLDTHIQALKVQLDAL
jgi:hypothetical protein